MLDIAHGRCVERLHTGCTARAADSRQIYVAQSRSTTSPCPRTSLGREPSLHRSVGYRGVRARAADDAASARSVVAATLSPRDRKREGGEGAGRSGVAGGWDADPGREPDGADAGSAGIDASLALLSEQLEDRRLSNTAASTSTGSAAAGPPRGPPSAPASGSPRPPDLPNRTIPAVAPPRLTQPSLQRPSSTSPASSGPPSPPGPSALVPPEAVQLYAGTPVSRDLSTTTANTDVLASLFEHLQVEPPTTSNVQRVYKSGPSGSGSSSSSSEAAAASRAPATSRRRATARVLDASELLLARDEAVKTELLGRTWQDLLQFEERLGTGPGLGSGPGEAAAASEGRALAGSRSAGKPAKGAQRAGSRRRRKQAEVGNTVEGPGLAGLPGASVAAGAAAAAGSAVPAAVPDLETVVGIMQAKAAEELEQQQRLAAEPGPERGEQQQPFEWAQGQQQRQGLEGLLAGTRPSLEALMTHLVYQQAEWGHLRNLYDKRRSDFTPASLTALLGRLAFFYNYPGHVYESQRQEFHELWDMVVEQLIFMAPDLTGPQAVAAVQALVSLPMRQYTRVQSALLSIKRILVYSKPSVLPYAIIGDAAAEAAAGINISASGGGAGGSGGGILNTQEVAATKRPGRRSPPAAGVGAAAAGATQQPASAVNRVSQPPAPGVPASPAGLPGVMQPQAPSSAFPTPQSRPPPASAGFLSPHHSIDEPELAPPRADPNAMSGRDYARLAYLLGKMNAIARPFRMSLRLPPSVTRGLLLGCYATMRRLRPPDFARLLYGLSLLRVAPPKHWLYAFYVTSVRSLHTMSAVQLTMALYGACRLPLKPPQPWIDSCLGVIYRRLGVDIDPTALALMMHSLGRMRYKPRPEWLHAHLSLATRALADRALLPEEMSALMRGLAAVGVRPGERLLAELWQASGEAMVEGRFRSAQLVNMAWALGLLKVRAPRRWYQEFLLHMQRLHHLLLRPFHRRRLLTALHAFGCRSKELRSWYELLQIPVEEMPGHKAYLAVLAMHRVQKARAQLLAERMRAQQQQRHAQGQGQQQGQGQAEQQKQSNKGQEQPQRQAGQGNQQVKAQGQQQQQPGQGKGEGRRQHGQPAHQEAQGQAPRQEQEQSGRRKGGAARGKKKRRGPLKQSRVEPQEQQQGQPQQPQQQQLQKEAEGSSQEVQQGQRKVAQVVSKKRKGRQ